MPLAASRFGSQILSAPFNPHHQQSHGQHQTNQHQPPRSAGLPSPSYNTHSSFTPGNQNSILNPFAASNGTSGLAAGFAGGGGGLGGGGTGLASQAAISGFAHGAQMQQQQLTRDAVRRAGAGSKAQVKNRIRDVWEDNLEQEMQNLRDLVEQYPYISMDTEFPGIVVRPMGQFRTTADYHYQTLRCNVDLLRVIQLGITLFSEDGEMPPAYPGEAQTTSGLQHNYAACPYTWQFNFQFSPDNDMYNQDSINFLLNSGMDMDKHEKSGINPTAFGAMLISSGLVLMEDVRWISFHSGYDFAYLVKLMFCKPLPDDEVEYRKLLSIFFPAIYDIKYMVKAAQRNQIVNSSPLSATAASILTNLGSKSGLQDLADELGIKRIGAAHQAGSDSLLTGKVFWDVKKNIFNGTIDDDKYLGQVWGLNGIGGGPGSSAGAHSGIEGQSTPNLNGATVYSSNGTPSTPNNAQQGISNTPVQQHLGNGGGMGQPTPVNGASGAFGRFSFGKG